MRTIGAMRAAPESRVDLDKGTGAGKLKSPCCAKLLGMQPLNQVLQALIVMAETLLGVTEPRIRGQSCESTMMMR